MEPIDTLLREIESKIEKLREEFNKATDDTERELILATMKKSIKNYFKIKEKVTEERLVLSAKNKTTSAVLLRCQAKLQVLVDILRKTV